MKNVSDCLEIMIIHTTRNILDSLYHQNAYKRIGIDLSRKTNASIPQQINVIGKLEDGNLTMFFIAEKQHSKLF